jgi:hypothetical protein
MSNELDDVLDDNDDNDADETIAARLVAKYKTAERAIEVIAAENRKMRRQRKELQGKVPKEGDIVLSGTNAEKWKALAEYDPADVKNQLAERETLAKEVAQGKREKAIAAAAKAAGYNAAVLGRLAGKDLQFEVTGEGDKQVATVKGADGKVIPLTEYAKANWAEFASALSVTGTRQGASWAGQPAANTGGAAPQTLVAETIERNKARANAENALTKKG